MFSGSTNPITKETERAKKEEEKEGRSVSIVSNTKVKAQQTATGKTQRCKSRKWPPVSDGQWPFRPRLKCPT